MFMCVPKSTTYIYIYLPVISCRLSNNKFVFIKNRNLDSHIPLPSAIHKLFLICMSSVVTPDAIINGKLIKNIWWHLQNLLFVRFTFQRYIITRTTDMCLGAVNITTPAFVSPGRIFCNKFILAVSPTIYLIVAAWFVSDV